MEHPNEPAAIDGRLHHHRNSARQPDPLAEWLRHGRSQVAGDACVLRVLSLPSQMPGLPRLASVPGARGRTTICGCCTHQPTCDALR